MKFCIALVLAACLVSTISAQTTTYNITLTGANQSPPVNTTATATAIISFNPTNITYNLTLHGVPDPTAAHIHVSAGPGENGSVGVPLFMANFAAPPGAKPVSGLVASNAVVPQGFVGPLEVLPLYQNVPVPQVLSQYVQPERAYVQVHTKEYPYGYIRGNFGYGSVIDTAVVPATAPVTTL